MNLQEIKAQLRKLHDHDTEDYDAELYMLLERLIEHLEEQENKTYRCSCLNCLGPI